jgi:hypothetical protein
MEKQGYGLDERLAIKVATRSISEFRDPALIHYRPEERAVKIGLNARSNSSVVMSATLAPPPPTPVSLTRMSVRRARCRQPRTGE